MLAIKRIILLLMLSSGLFAQARWTSEDKLAGWNFTSGWTASAATINSATQFTVNVNTGFIRKNTVIEIGKTYIMRVVGTTNLSSSLIVSDYNQANAYKTIATGNFDQTFTFVAKTTGIMFYGVTSGAGTVTISSMTLQEVLLSSPIAKAKTNFVTTPASSLVNEPNCVFAYEGNAPINKTIVDISGNGNNGTLYGGTMYAGGLDGGLQFNGTSSYVSVADANSLDFGTGDFSVEWRMTYPITQSLTFSGIISKGQSTSAPAKAWGIMVNNATTNEIVYLESSAGGGSYTVFANSPAIPNGTHHFILVRTSTLVTVYMDGSSFYSKAITASDLTNAYALEIGSGASRFIKSTIYSAKLYNVALTSQQVKDRWNKIANRPYILEDFSDTQTGKFPRDWTRISGTHTVQQLATAEGYLKAGTKYLRTDVSGVVAFPSNQAYGRWSFDVYKGANNNLVRTIPIASASTGWQGYSFNIFDLEEINLSRASGGVNSESKFSSASSYIANSTWYHIDIERTTAGQFSVYITGGAFTTKTLVSTVGGSGTNPITDNTYTSSKWFVLDLDANDRITNIKMYKNIPVN